MNGAEDDRGYRGLTSLRLAVVGCGALGSELCRRLAERKHKHVLVIDPDCLEERNLALSGLIPARGAGCPNGGAGHWAKVRQDWR